MGTPFMGFMQDEFKWSRKKSALTFGIIILLLGLPTVFFFQMGVFDEYDYWAGTVSLVIFAMLEIILFSWIFGLKQGWNEITSGADIKIPIIYKYIIKYITPIMLIIVFFGALVRPENDDWSKLSFKGWKIHNESIIGQITHKGIGPNADYFSDKFFSEVSGKIDSIYNSGKSQFINITTTNNSSVTYETNLKNKILVKKGDNINIGDVLYTGNIINKIFYIDMARILLISTFIGISILVYIAYRKRKKKGVIS